MTSEIDPIMELHFTPTNGPVDEVIEDLMSAAGGIAHRAIVREMILSALKAGQENSGRADLKLMNASLKEMRFTTKIFGAYRHKRKVTVFGSARTRPEAPSYQMAVDLGRQLAAAGSRRRRRCPRNQTSRISRTCRGWWWISTATVSGACAS